MTYSRRKQFVPEDSFILAYCIFEKGRTNQETNKNIYN